MLTAEDIVAVMRMERAVGYDRGSCFGSVDPSRSEAHRMQYEDLTPIALPEKSFAEKILENYPHHASEITPSSKWREYILFV